jgi:hypothetical protein
MTFIVPNVKSHFATFCGEIMEYDCCLECFQENENGESEESEVED